MFESTPRLNPPEFRILTKHSHSLPDDLFVAGETRPTKKKKKSKAKEPAQAVDKKRSADAAGLHVSLMSAKHDGLRAGLTSGLAHVFNCPTADMLNRRTRTLVLLSAQQPRPMAPRHLVADDSDGPPRFLFAHIWLWLHSTLTWINSIRHRGRRKGQTYFGISTSQRACAANGI